MQLFFQEEFLRKLSASQYKDNLILKGGLFIYTLTNFESRATVDVDFMLRGISNDIARMDTIIAEILAVPTENDFITFKVLPTEPIAAKKVSRSQHTDHRLYQECACAVQCRFLTLTRTGESKHN